MARRIAKITLICVAMTLLTLVMLEIGIRLVGETNSDGQFLVANRVLPPYRLPLNTLLPAIQKYLDNKEAATIIPDPETGWTFRPDSQRQNGEFTINGAGLRSHREYALQPASDTLRIALFGDSFVAGDEVKDEEVWGWRLEQQLVQAGYRAEVLNFGVGGYGMDQAFLRWQSLGKDYSPDLVIFVFQAENLDRNVNVFRKLYPHARLVYSKPRFILEDDALTPVNSPALPPEELSGVFNAFESHPLAENEAYYNSRDFTSPIWTTSKLAGLAHLALNRLRVDATPMELYGPASERGQLGKAIVDAFAADVVESGATFIVLHLPRFDHFRDYHDGKRAPWQFLLDYFDQAYHFINAEEFLGVKYTDDAYYQPQNHYGPEINAIIAEALSKEIVTCIQENTCDLSRFKRISDITS